MSNFDDRFLGDEEYFEIMSASASDPLRPPIGKTREEWTEIQRARSDYLKEWEEDLRYAVELANEGM